MARLTGLVESSAFTVCTCFSSRLSMEGYDWFSTSFPTPQNRMQGWFLSRFTMQERSFSHSVS